MKVVKIKASNVNKLCFSSKTKVISNALSITAINSEDYLRALGLKFLLVNKPSLNSLGVQITIIQVVSSVYENEMIHLQIFIETIFVALYYTCFSTYNLFLFHISEDVLHFNVVFHSLIILDLS